MREGIIPIRVEFVDFSGESDIFELIFEGVALLKFFEIILPVCAKFFPLSRNIFLVGANSKTGSEKVEM